ncbi:hypothetical protein [Flavihumibacter sp. UBA7668]|uniref:hypothetical protein n=1 Tax=Flavihumibacter sp. UBA7668 TaxID=1946542 RepID=UPI0025C1104F|nr:hypothetical protein [Flavihumibacter sp. UBA7668]
MKNNLLLLSSLFMLFCIGCDKKNKDLVLPVKPEKFPQVIRFADEIGGELEDSDEFSIDLTLVDRVDPEGEELGGKVVPLQQDVRVFFTVSDNMGIDDLASYIKAGTALYEIDACTSSEDEGIDLDFQFDPATGNGSVVFPKGVEEMELVFEVDEDYLNDAVLNEEERAIEFKLVSVDAATENVVVNTALSFTYEVLDDEGVHGAWELDLENTAQFAAFKELFGLVNEDIAALNLADVEKIEITFELEEVKVLVELKETELLDECGETEEVNKVIELELELEELSTLTSSGELEATGELELEDGSLLEYVLAGEFSILDNELKLELTNELEEESVTAELLLTR